MIQADVYDGGVQWQLTQSYSEREKTTNKEEMKTYSALAQQTLRQRTAKLLAFYGALDVLEGPAFEGAVILEFASMTEARAWYKSSEYQAAAKQRRAGASFRVFLLEGNL